MTDKRPCSNAACLDGFYPNWDAADREVECPDCHGTGNAAHECDAVCGRLIFGSPQ